MPGHPLPERTRWRHRLHAETPVVTLRVLSVPSGHVYVRHLSSARPDGVVRLPDPPVPGAPEAAQWWPPPALDPSWVSQHLEDFDVFHVHFGFDASSPEQLRELVAL